MSTSIGFLQRLTAILRPTMLQILGGVVLSLAVLVASQIQGILPRLGITTQAITATQDKFHDRFDAILRSPVSSHLALMTFWALVGLVAYLICWGIYNVFVEARNEVTLTTAYTNRGHWRGPYETLAIKAVAGLGLAFFLTTFWSGVSIWMALAAPMVNFPALDKIPLALASVIGLAIQLYLVLVFVQLTFTPWYSAVSFTEE